MYLGDYAPSAILDFKFPTRNTSAVMTTLSGSPVVSVYKSNSTTQTTTGVTLTVDFDSLTGCNHVHIDTSADGTFYSGQTDFEIVITTGTVGGVSVVGEVVGAFSINNRSALRPATPGRTLIVDVNGLADANAVKLGPTGSGTAQTARDIGASVLLSSGTGAGQLSITSGIANVNVNSMAANTLTASALATDAVTELTDAMATRFGPGPYTSDTGPFDANLTSVASNALVGSGLVLAQSVIGSTGNDTTHVHIPTLSYADDQINNYLLVIYDVSATEYHSRWIDDWTNSSKLALVTTLPFTPQNATDKYWLIPIRKDVSGSGLDAAATRAALGLASANLDSQLTAIDDYIDTEVAAIKAKTDNLPASPAATSDCLTAANVRTAIGLATANLDTQLGTIITDTTTLKTKTNGLVMGQSTIGSTGNDSTHVHIPSLTYADDQINDCLLVVLDVSTSEYHARWISDWVNSTKLVTVATLPFTPQNGVDNYWLLSMRRDVTASTLDAPGIRAALGMSSANLDSQLTAIDDYIDTEIAAIKAKTDNLPASPAAVGSAMTLAAGAISDATITLPAETNGYSTTFFTKMLHLYNRMLSLVNYDKVGGTLTTTHSDGVTTQSTQPVTVDADNEIVGKAT